MPLIYRPNHPAANENGMVERALVYAHEPDAGFHVISDDLGQQLEHMAYADGRRTDSKSVFRRWTREAGCVEKGNDREPPKAAPLPDIRADVAQAVQMLRQGYRPNIQREWD